MRFLYHHVNILPSWPLPGTIVSCAFFTQSSQGEIMEKRMQSLINAVKPVDSKRRAQGQAHLDNLTKPRGSLGRLEELALKIWLIQGTHPLNLDPVHMYTFAGDHGVADMGVSPYPREVTRQQVANMVAGGAAISVLCAANGIRLTAVDVGVAGGEFATHPDLVQHKIAPGTANIAEGPAMTPTQCMEAFLTGADMAHRAAESGCRCVGSGEMGIGNTTPATALFCAYLGLLPKDITGPGAGLTAQGVSRKITVIESALAANKKAVESKDPFAILTALGGLEIAAMTGFMVAAAAHSMVVLVDGFICTAAYTAAWKMAPALEEYAIFCHSSAERGYAAVMDRLGQRPVLHLDMRLGEGTGSAVALPILRSAVKMFNDMATFDSAGVTGKTIDQK